MGLHVIISGCHSGPNPSAGLGVALSLRTAFADATLEAKDYSVASTGIHHPIFNRCWVSPSWDDLHLPHHQQQIHARLDKGAWYVSTLDLEVRWLAKARHERVLSPDEDALKQCTKPTCEAAQVLPVRIPEWISCMESDKAIAAFCHWAGWPVWVKGPHYEGIIAHNWEELRRASEELGDRWGTRGLYVQADVHGLETSIVIAGWKGELLDAIQMEKRIVTEQGKTWAGEVFDLTSTVKDRLASFVADLKWTGGGELECVRDHSGNLWLIDCNPRFPAWIHGATLAGRNLPAALIAKASGIEAATSGVTSTRFVRVVTEIPTRATHPIQPLRETGMSGMRVGKHPSGMPRLHRRLSPTSEMDFVGKEHGFSRVEVADLQGYALRSSSTPYRALLGAVMEDQFSRLAALCHETAAELPFNIRPAYSVKTNPDARILRTARDKGYYAETISPAEVCWAVRNGFDWDDILYNGPHALDDTSLPAGKKVYAAFADSLSSFAAYARTPPARIVGVRLRPPAVSSRFGVQIGDPASFDQVVDVLRLLPRGVGFGFSIHIQSSAIGLNHWHAVLKGLVHFCGQIERLIQRCVCVLDFGGGWAAGDSERVLRSIVPDALGRYQRDLGQCDVVVEPGKSLVEPCGAVLTKVLEVRQRRDHGEEVVVDAGICDLPMASFSPHRVAVLKSGRVIPAAKGNGKVLGRLCMETDCLVHDVGFPVPLHTGDLLAICDAGAYDASMSYLFGVGCNV